ADIPGNLASAHREANKRNVREFERVEHRIEVGRKRVVVVANGGLAGSAEASAVVGDNAMTGGKQCRGLLFPRRAVQRPAVYENHRRSGAMILVVEIDGR